MTKEEKKEYGTCLMGGTPAYCYKTGLRIDWDFICNEYKELKKSNGKERT